MKFLIFVCIAAVISRTKALTDEQKKLIKEVHAECMPETGVDQAVIEKAMKGEFTDDAKFKAYLVCFGKKTTLMADDGEFNKDMIKTKMLAEGYEEAEINSLLEKCAVKKDTPEDTAFEGVKCMHANVSKHLEIID